MGISEIDGYFSHHHKSQVNEKQLSASAIDPKTYEQL